jgi:hypothetical protein
MEGAMILELKSFEMLHKDRRTDGCQAVLDFGNYHLSIINDGYGCDRGLYEIGVFKAADGVASELVSLPGITNDDDTVKGYLTEADVDAIIKKMYLITGNSPRQI